MKSSRKKNYDKVRSMRWALASWNFNFTLFYHLKKPLHHYIIPFYNTSSIPKLYYFTILLKCYFLSPQGKHKTHFFYLSSDFFSFLPLSLLSHFSINYLGLIKLRFVPVISWVCAPVLDRDTSFCGSWYGSMLRLWVYAPMGFCWLCSDSGFLLVMVVRFVGLAVLNGVTIGLAVGCGCHRQWRHRAQPFDLWCWVGCAVGCSLVKLQQ